MDSRLFEFSIGKSRNRANLALFMMVLICLENLRFLSLWIPRYLIE